MYINQSLIFSGILTSGGAEAQGFYYSTPSHNKPYPSTDIQLIMMPLLFGSDGTRLQIHQKKLNQAADVG